MFNPTEIIKPLRDTELLALIKAATDELIRMQPDDCRIEEAAGNLEDAVAEYSVAFDQVEVAFDYDPRAEHSLSAAQLGIVTGRAA